MNNSQQHSISLSPILFSHHLTPINLALVAAGRGFRTVAPTQPFTYTDLACGNGAALCMLAECYPWASFFGFDRSREGIEEGKSLAERAGLTNVVFEMVDWNANAIPDVPHSDFFVVSGLYSWANDQTRSTIMQEARNKVSDNGLFCLHYSVKPGMVQVDAVYDLMRILSMEGNNTPGSSVENSLKTADVLRQKRANLFAANSPGSQFLEQLMATQSDVTQREILEYGQRSFWFGEVAKDAKQMGFDFVGQAQMGMNSLKLRVPLEHRDYISGIGNIAQRESIADVLNDAVMRIDLYAKPLASAGRQTVLDQVADLYVRALPAGSEPMALDQLSQSTGINLRSPVYQAILSEIGVDGASVSQIAANDGLSAFEEEEWWKALLLLYTLNLLEIGFETDQRIDTTVSSTIVMATRLNSVLMEEHLLSPQPIGFSGPAYGKPILLGMKERLLLFFILGGDVGNLWERLGKQGLTVHDAQQKPIASLESLKSILAKESELVSNTLIPHLIRMGAATMLPPEGPQ